MKAHFQLSVVLVCLLVVFTGSGLILPVAAQMTLNLEYMPSSRVNTPALDLFQLRRPALSIVGFDNGEPGYNPDHGLGLKQILESVYIDHDPLVIPIYDRIIEIANETQIDPYSFSDKTQQRIQLDRNTIILESRAFEALVTFVLELNGFSDTGLRSHAEAMADMKAAFVHPPGGVFIAAQDIVDDLVKYGRSICNVARAIDLYLALENAYEEFAKQPAFATKIDPDLLLSVEERFAVLGEFGLVLLGVDEILRARAIDLYAGEINLPPELKDLLLLVFQYIPTGDRVVEEVEPGNWAIKQRVAIGYGAMAVQAIPGVFDETSTARLAELRERAIRSVAVVGKDEGDRLRHWSFQSLGGKRFWAESPYYLDFALEQVLPFWHALRANGLLGTISDPFHSSWFTNPLHWHADLVTPDGRIVPLDDGNKAPVRYSSLMRWAPSYGDEMVGRKFAWIDERLGGPGRKEETLPVELAIPRTSMVESPVDRVGSEKKELIRHQTEQQLVVRESTMGNETHYVVLNGEHGASVDRGEGHEQPDQLQLLYYKDNLSYLLDSGYDQGATVENSSWNHYYDHNVLTAGEGEGGLRPPFLSLFEVRKSSEPWFMGEVSSLYLEEHGSITVLHGKQRLTVEPRFFYKADYTRDVLFVGGPDPYLIDFGRIQHIFPPRECEANRFRMIYHANAKQITVPVNYQPRYDGFLQWGKIGEQDGRYLHIFPMSVEFDLTSPMIAALPDNAMEREGSSGTEAGPVGKELVEIKKLVLYNAERCESYWSLASIIQTGETAAPAGQRPELVWNQNNSTGKQGWIWPRGNDVFDVFIARSIANPETEVSFSPHRVNAAFPKIDLVLPSGLPYGFARLERKGNGWRIDPEYQIHLKATGTTKQEVAHGEGAEVVVEGPFTLSDPYPNPFNPTAQFTLNLQQDQEVTIEVYDAMGRSIAVLHRGLLQSGRIHTFEIDGSTWASGLYLVRIIAKGFVATRPLMMIK